ncbi:hypothetical protein [Fusobacterium nucleatum]|uniref:Uncharacterized protein n=1 Tax=Fusobacterium nucleatum TaxID=851 RepID=A0A133P615_FUSNU|nr:hypothetical protein [Fusobacterium nucleatum]KXA24007.1 hypothetical protein HMPREF3221_00605 [Fusobacterium nucleatum]
MKLKNIKITDKNPLLIQFGAYAKWDGTKDILFPREEETVLFLGLRYLIQERGM